MQMGIGPAANSDADKETWENYESRGYGSLCAVKRPDAAGTDATNGGFALGTTFNESKFFVNSSDQSPYYNRRSFDIEEDTVPYEKEVDFGMGAYDAEAGTGGMITNHRPDYGFNSLNLDAILAGTEYGTRQGDPLAFTMVASGGGAGDTAATQDTHVTMITDLVETRKDCVGFASPYRSATVGVASSAATSARAVNNVKTAFDLVPASSYMVYDSGYKYMYDKYNDVFRFVPLCGDTAGLCANTDQVADSFFSPAGFTRGRIRGAIKLSYNPNNAERDRLYRARVNPVVNFSGQGATLFGCI